MVGTDSQLQLLTEGCTIPSEPKPKLFISYRFADKPIADVIRTHLARWGFDDIYQAGAPGTGPRVGEPLSDELKGALHEVALVILVYTFADEDWSWCMWECGLATHDATHLVVLRCSKHDTPRLFAQQVMVDVDIDGLHNFTAQLHRDEEFFPGMPAYRPTIADKTLRELSSAFYEDLRPVIPAGQREERYRWDRFTLKVEFAANRLREQLSKERDQDIVCELIQSELVVTRPFGNALKHFGYDTTLEGSLKLRDLVGRWTEETRDRENVSTGWIKGLCLEIQRAILAFPAEPIWLQVKSVVYDHASYYPVLNHMRVLPDGTMEFDVYLYAAHPD